MQVSYDNIHKIDLLTYSTVLIFIIIFLLLTKNKTRPAYKTMFSYKYMLNTIFLVFAVFIINSPLLNRHDYGTNNSAIFMGFLNFLILVIIPPLNEELIFRRAILRMFESGRKNVFIGILVSSILFTIAHFNFNFGENYKFLTTIFILGLLFGIIYYKYGLIYSIISHSLYSFFIFLYTDIGININILNYINNNILNYIIYCLICIIFLYFSTKLLRLIVSDYKQ